MLMFDSVSPSLGFVSSVDTHSLLFSDFPFDLSFLTPLLVLFPTSLSRVSTPFDVFLRSRPLSTFLNTFRLDPCVGNFKSEISPR